MDHVGTRLVLTAITLVAGRQLALMNLIGSSPFSGHYTATEQHVECTSIQPMLTVHVLPSESSDQWVSRHRARICPDVNQVKRGAFNVSSAPGVEARIEEFGRLPFSATLTLRPSFAATSQLRLLVAERMGSLVLAGPCKELERSHLQRY